MASEDAPDDEARAASIDDRQVDASVTALLLAHRAAAPGSSERLFAAIYPELRRLARGLMRRERRDHTLQPTDLVHDAFVKLVDRSAIEAVDRAHFLAVAARAMRQILVDHARRRGAQKRGGEYRERVTFDEALGHGAAGSDRAPGARRRARPAGRERSALGTHPRAQGLRQPHEHRGRGALEISKRTVETDWSYGRLWLTRAIRGA